MLRVPDRLDRLTERLAASGDAEPGQNAEQRDVTILASLPGVGRIVLATLLAEAFDPLQRRDYHALRCLCGVAPVTKRGPEGLIDPKGSGRPAKLNESQRQVLDQMVESGPIPAAHGVVR